MSADQVLKSGYSVTTDIRYAADSPVRDVDGQAQFEPFALQWRTLPAKDKIKKGIFLFSLVAAAGYYLFLGVLFLIR